MWKKDYGCRWQQNEKMLGLFSPYINLPHPGIAYFYILAALHITTVLSPCLLSFEDEDHILGLMLPAGFWCRLTGKKEYHGT